MTVLNLSFAACGFLGIYHLGATEAFLRHGHKLLGSLGACAGASAGALVAAVMITAPEKLEVSCTVQGYVGSVKPSGLWAECRQTISVFLSPDSCFFFFSTAVFMCVNRTKDFVGVKDAQGYLLSQTWRSVCFSDARCISRSYKITTQIWVIKCKFRNLDEQQAIEWNVIKRRTVLVYPLFSVLQISDFDCIEINHQEKWIYEWMNFVTLVTDWSAFIGVCFLLPALQRLHLQVCWQCEAAAVWGRHTRIQLYAHAPVTT